MKLMVIHGQYPPEEVEVRRKHVLETASSETKIEFFEIGEDIFALSHNADDELISMLAGPRLVEKAQEAEKSGFHAVLAYGTLDFGVDAACSRVEIPVVGMGRSAFCVAANVASRIAVIAYQSTMIPNTWKYIRAIGLQGFVTSVRAVDISLKHMSAQREILKEAFIKLARRAATEEGAEIIVPRGISIVPRYFSAEEISKEAQIPVIDCVAAGVKTVEMMVSMGMKNSRKVYSRGR